MLKNRWLLVVLTFVMTTCVVVAILAIVSMQIGVTKENSDRIQVGMTRADVERILGAKGVIERAWPPVRSWYANDCDAGVQIGFDERDCVLTKEWIPSPWPDERTPWQKLVDRVRGRKNVQVIMIE